MMKNNLVAFVSQWMTIRPSLFCCLDDELGELDEDQKTFVRVCSWVLDERNFSQYRWCGTGCPPASRLAIFKAFVLKAVMNYPTTKLLISSVRQSPVLRRLCAFVSSANLNDAKAMIPMMQKVSEGFDYFYDFADAGYDAAEIRQTSIALNHVPIIDRNPRRGERNVDDIGGRRVSIVDATTRRYYVRSGIERVFSHLHEAHGGKFVRVRGSAKVLLHLMFGLIVIAAEQIYANGMLT